MPFPRENDLAKLWAHLSDPPPVASERVAEVTPALSALVGRAIAKSPDDRFSSAGELGSAAVAATSPETSAPTKAAGGPAQSPRMQSPRARSRPRTHGIVRPTGTGTTDARLYERERELGKAEVELDAATSGSGRVLMIEGQAGIGKSSLLGEVAGLADGRGFEVFGACGLELERDYAYGVVRQLFEDRVQRFEALERAQLFRGAAGLAESLFLRTEPPAAARSESPEDRMFAVLHGLYWFCAELSELAPVLLAIDDADRADEASMRFVAHLAPRLEGLAVAVVIARRPAEPGGRGQALRDVEAHAAARLAPRPLSPAGSAALVRGRLGGGDPELYAACHSAAQGNPFLLGELCATMQAEGLAPTAAAAPVVESGSDRAASPIRASRGSGGSPPTPAALFRRRRCWVPEPSFAMPRRSPSLISGEPRRWQIRWSSAACSPRRYRSSSFIRL